MPMADSEDTSDAILDWKRPLYGDILSERTEKTGRALLLVAIATLLVSVFNVSIKTIPGAPIDFSNQPAALEMFLAVINVGLLVAYGLRLGADYLRAKEEWVGLVKFFESKKTHEAFKVRASFSTSLIDRAMLARSG
jgi:hypothetical protein